jgi:Tol biopolymer transport system component
MYYARVLIVANRCLATGTKFMTFRAAPTPFALVTLLALLLALFPASTPQPALAATGRAFGALIAGGFVVYSGNFNADARIDLYTVPAEGGTPLRLSAGLPDGEVEEFVAASNRVVFSWRYDGKVGLYSAPLAGGLPTRLNPEYTVLNTGDQLRFSLAGDLVVFAVPQDRPEVGVLYSVPATGGTPTRLSAALPDVGSGVPWKVDTVVVSDDGSTVAYTLEVTSGAQSRLYTVPAAGGASTLVSLATDSLISNPSSIALTADGARVVYRTVVATQSGQGVKLVSVTKTGAGRQELDTAAQIEFRLTPDGTRAVYFRSDAPFDMTGELRSVLLTGGDTVPLASGVAKSFALTPGSGDALFAPSSGGLSRIPAAGGVAQTVLASGFPDLDFSLGFSAGGSAVFKATDGGGVTKLYSYPLAGGTANVISDDAVSSQFLGDFLLAGERAIYFAIATGAQPQLYSVSLAGGASVKLNGPFEGGENLLRPFSAADGKVLYGVWQQVFGQRPAYTRLLVAAADGAGEPVALSLSSPEDPSATFSVYLPLVAR